MNNSIFSIIAQLKIGSGQFVEVWLLTVCGCGGVRHVSVLYYCEGAQAQDCVVC